MAARMIIRSGRPRAPATMADHVSTIVDNLCRLQQLAGNERRGAALTEELLDGLALEGARLIHLARGTSARAPR